MDLKLIWLLLYFGLGGSIISSAQHSEPELIYPELADQVSTMESICPPGWTILSTSGDDFNEDGPRDTVLVIQSKTKLHSDSKQNELSISEELTARILLIYFRESESIWKKACQSNTAVLSEGEGGNNEDPFRELKTGEKNIQLSFAGGNSIKWKLNYTFSYKNGDFFLIKANSSGGSTTERYSYSYDLLSGKLEGEEVYESNPKENRQFSRKIVPEFLPRLERFAPFSLVVDEKEEIIF